MISRFAAKGADRQAAADDLAERRQVGSNAVQFLGAAVGHPESAHDFIEDEDNPFLVAEVAQTFEEALPGRNGSHVAGNRFDDDAGDLSPVFGHQGLH